jgi:hypothetical protein
MVNGICCAGHGMAENAEIGSPWCGENLDGRWRQLTQLADILRDFNACVSAEQASNSFGASRVRPISLFGTVENLTHLTECFRNFSSLDCVRRVYG